MVQDKARQVTAPSKTLQHRKSTKSTIINFTKKTPSMSHQFHHQQTTSVAKRQRRSPALGASGRSCGRCPARTPRLTEMKISKNLGGFSQELEGLVMV